MYGKNKITGEDAQFGIVIPERIFVVQSNVCPSRRRSPFGDGRSGRRQVPESGKPAN
jgi:hypothetical protein